VVSSYRHYYFIPQLTVLSYGQAPPVTPAAFVEKASAVLDERDTELLGMLGIGPVPRDAERSGCGFVDGLRDWETALRLHLARLRAAALGRDAGALPPAPAVPVSAAEAAARAMAAETPLEGEGIIDRARWNAVEALQGGELFHRRTVFAYLVKLMILERQAGFTADAGFSQYSSLYGSVLERAGKTATEAASGGEADDRN